MTTLINGRASMGAGMTVADSNWGGVGGSLIGDSGTTYDQESMSRRNTLAATFHACHAHLASSIHSDLGLGQLTSARERYIMARAVAAEAAAKTFGPSEATTVDILKVIQFETMEEKEEWERAN
jgi:hypothetical protein